MSLTWSDKKLLSKVVENLISELQLVEKEFQLRVYQHLLERVDFALYLLGIYTILDRSPERTEAYEYALAIFEEKYFSGKPLVFAKNYNKIIKKVVENLISELQLVERGSLRRVGFWLEAQEHLIERVNFIAEREERIYTYALNLFEEKIQALLGKRRFNYL